MPPRVRPLSPEALATELADRAEDLAGAARAAGRWWLRVAVDGAEAAGPDELADALVAPIRLRGHPAVRVRAGDYLRPASLRFERGRADPDSFYEDYVDLDALRRDVLERLGPDGDGRIRRRRWDAARDRATRDGFETVDPGGIVILSGQFLLGSGLPFDFSVHIELSPGALARRTAPERAWTLPAYARYVDEVNPAEVVDVVVRADDPRRPALVLSPGRGEGPLLHG